MSEDKAGVAGVLHAYAKAYDTLDPEALIPFYHEPCLLIAPPGVFVLATHADITRLFAPFMLNLKARGYRGSAYREVQAKVLNESTAMISGVCTRSGAGGEPLERFGQTCTLRLNKDRWCIAVNAIHEPETALKF